MVLELYCGLINYIKPTVAPKLSRLPNIDDIPGYRIQGYQNKEIPGYRIHGYQGSGPNFTGSADLVLKDNMLF